MKAWAPITFRMKRGFTIVELLIVVVVIGILASVILVSYGRVAANAADTTVKSDLKKVDDAFKLYKLDNGTYPDTTTKLATLKLKLSGDAYYTDDLANIYLCVNAARSEYAVIAKGTSGKRFMMRSEQGLGEYTGSVVWDDVTAHWSETCTDINPAYVSPSNITGLQGPVWQDWTGVEG